MFEAKILNEKTDVNLINRIDFEVTGVKFVTCLTPILIVLKLSTIDLV